ncbi:MAG: hypothetical protein ACK5LC_06010 [Coprobacillaceae bacterium]
MRDEIKGFLEGVILGKYGYKGYISWGYSEISGHHTVLTVNVFRNDEIQTLATQFPYELNEINKSILVDNMLSAITKAEGKEWNPK